MQKLKILFLLPLAFFINISFAQDDPVIIEYIKTYKDIAIKEMQRTGIPASIKLAQGIHETEAGTSPLVLKSNNHFGLKCKSDWTGMSVSHTDDAPNECFRKYNSPIESYTDQSDYLKKTSRYNFLFELDPTDYKNWAMGLKKAGYATNPKYPQIIIKLVEDYHLQDYTLIAMGKLKLSDDAIANSKEKKQEIIAVKKQETNSQVTSANKLPPVVSATSAVVVKEEKKTNELPVYPVGEFKINETRVLYASKGTSYLSIAEKFALPLSRIFEFNDMKEQDVVEKDQLIYLMRKRKTGNNDQHIVKAGESLNDIAQTEALRIESLLEYNYLKPGMKPAPGTVLYLKAKAPSMPETVSGN